MLDIIFENFYTFTKSTVNFGYYLHASIIQLLPRLRNTKVIIKNLHSKNISASYLVHIDIHHL
ncbi:hypothetical protein DQM68_08385 [Leptospira mayottensis]|uniref:DUF1564 family protein n=1 Tax=Leptospira mayottensis TaxID=1137606 RepID=A0ABM6Y9A1_9LEPT|nr:hypothetical protein DQM68_08385 [Leptospira mayottensis]AXR64564.1 hypothetical protein DQM28_10345 [Leptospira mayottensis]AZQ02868.1 hypothetical protein LEP1GSC190_13305 [Leptospira mayottensis 200901116]